MPSKKLSIPVAFVTRLNILPFFLYTGLSSSLHPLVIAGNVSVVRNALSLNRLAVLQINTRDEGGWGYTPLYYAITTNLVNLNPHGFPPPLPRDRYNMVKLLLENKALTTVSSRGGVLPLHCAMHDRVELEIITLLLAHENISNVINAQDEKQQRTALYLAGSFPWGPLVEKMRLLLEAGADPDIPTSGGDTPLRHVVERIGACLKKTSNATSDRLIEALQVLLEYGVNPTFTPLFRRAWDGAEIRTSALHFWAIITSDPQLVNHDLAERVWRILLFYKQHVQESIREHKQNILGELTKTFPNIPLELRDIIASYIAYRKSSAVDINAVDHNGCTVLMKVLQGKKNAQYVSMLIKAGASLTIADKNGKTTQAYARENGYENILEETLKRKNR